LPAATETTGRCFFRPQVSATCFKH